jgi:hypothetical protein
MRASSRLVLAVVGSFVALAAAPAARAKQRFPGMIASELGLGYVPPCRLCHIQGTTGAGSVSTPFGVSMLAHGMTQDESTIAPALAALQADGTDSDGDGQGDIAELKADTDPNTPVDVPLAGSDPQYGCSVTGAARPGTLSSLVLGLGAVFFARYRRGRARALR